MVHNILGFAGQYASLFALTPEARGATLSPLASGYGLLVHRRWNCDITEGAPSEDLFALGAILGARVPVALVATAYFGTGGAQAAAAWSPGGRLEYRSGKDSINTALRFIGAKQGEHFDEFDAVGLGWYRSNDDWITFARDGRLHWEREQSPDVAAAFSTASAFAAERDEDLQGHG
jgi:hypothetical protein